MFRDLGVRVFRIFRRFRVYGLGFRGLGFRVYPKASRPKVPNLLSSKPQPWPGFLFKRNCSKSPASRRWQSWRQGALEATSERR